MESIKQIEVNLLSILSPFGVDEYDIRTLTQQIKKNFIYKKVSENNLLKIKNHNLLNEDSTDISKSIWRDGEFNFLDIERKIKNHLASFGKEDVLKECYIQLEFKKTFGNPNQKYFSFHDFKKDKTPEQIKTEVINTINQSKKVCLDKTFYCDYSYKVFDTINDIKNFLNNLLGCNIQIEDLKDTNFKNYEDVINKQAIGFKVVLCQNWFYVSFSNIELERVFKDYIIKDTLKRLENI